MKFLHWLALLPILPINANALEETRDPACLRVISRELRQLSMGSYEQPANGVIRRESSDGSSLEFSRSLGETSQYVGDSAYPDSSHILTITSPSPVFLGLEMKKLFLSKKCEIKGLEIAVAGTGLYIDGAVCFDLAEANNIKDLNARSKAIEAIAPNAAWTESKFLVQLVEYQCRFYKGDWALK